MNSSSQSRGRLPFPAILGALVLIAVGVVGIFMSQSAAIVCAPDRPANSPNSPSPPADVFCYDTAVADGQVQINFVVDEGAYLYRDKLGFSSADPAVRLGTPQFPEGEMHEDEFFGEQVVFRNAFQIAIPYTRTADVASFELEIEFQGCDETIGLCYPPQNWFAAIDLPDGPIAAAPAQSTQAAPSQALPGNLFGTATSDEPLPVTQAFIPNPRFDAANELTVAWQIAPGYYLYRDNFTFTVDEGDIQFGPARMPAGTLHDDLEFGEVEVYFDDIDVTVPFVRAHPDEQSLVITVGFQGCKEDSICYPPTDQTFDLVLPASGEFPAPVTSTAPVRVSDQDRFAALITGGSWLAFLGAFYAAGLLLSLTPCVLPMVPILSGIIAGQGQNVSTGHGFALSVAYVLGMAFTYTVAGVLAALAGSQIQAIFQQPWIIATFAGLFVIMALGMFGLYEIQMPTAIQSRVSAMANKQRGGTFISTAIVGALTALIVTTCVAPPLIGALAVIGQTGDVVRGGLALFALSIGMGTPLLLVGASAGRLLPRVGPWMNTVKAAFGVMMIGMAIWMLERVLPGSLTLVLWALLIFLTGVFLGAFEALPEHPRPTRRLAKGIGVLACLYGALLLIGSRLGGESVLDPIPLTASSFAGQPAAAGELDFVDVATVAQLETMLGQARTAGQPVMVDFTADWCTACKEMEAYTFPDAGVIAALEPYMLLRIDITENDADDKALLDYFGTFGPPWMVFFDRSGRDLGSSWTLVGFTEADEFAVHAREVAAL